MQLLDDILKATKAVHDYFGYQEDWVVIPLDDCTKYYWHLTGEGSGDQVLFAEEEGDVGRKDGNYYSHEIYTQRYLKEWVFRAEDYTMVVADTHTDGNKFLCIFDNKLEILEIEEEG